MLSREYYYLGTQLPMDRFLTFYYGHPGFHINNILVILAVQIFMVTRSFLFFLVLSFTSSVELELTSLLGLREQSYTWESSTSNSPSASTTSSEISSLVRTDATTSILVGFFFPSPLLSTTRLTLFFLPFSSLPMDRAMHPEYLPRLLDCLLASLPPRFVFSSFWRNSNASPDFDLLFQNSPSEEPPKPSTDLESTSCRCLPSLRYVFLLSLLSPLSFHLSRSPCSSRLGS